MQDIVYIERESNNDRTCYDLQGFHPLLHGMQQVGSAEILLCNYHQFYIKLTVFHRIRRD